MIDPGLTKGRGRAPKRVAVIDGHPVMRYGLVHLIGGEKDMAVCAEAGDWETGLAAVRKEKPDGVIMDIDLPGGDGLELVRKIKAEVRHSAVFVVSKQDDSHHALRALRAGANGYATKTDAAENLLMGLRKVLAGDFYLGEDMAQRLIFQHIGAAGQFRPQLEDRLTARERELLGLIGEGLSTREIAAKLGISVKTVETHRGHLKDKLELASGKDLLQFAKDWAVQKE